MNWMMIVLKNIVIVSVLICMLNNTILKLIQEYHVLHYVSMQVLIVLVNKHNLCIYLSKDEAQ